MRGHLCSLFIHTSNLFYFSGTGLYGPFSLFYYVPKCYLVVREKYKKTIYTQNTSTMAIKQRYGIKYPFTLENNDEIYMDLNETLEDSLKSRLLHVIFTPKGQRLRNPDFGTDLIKYIHEPADETTYESLRNDISQQVYKYVPDVVFKDITIYDDENSENGKIVIIHYSIKKGMNEIEQTAALRV